MLLDLLTSGFVFIFGGKWIVFSFQFRAENELSFSTAEKVKSILSWSSPLSTDHRVTVVQFLIYQYTEFCASSLKNLVTKAWKLLKIGIRTCIYLLPIFPWNNKCHFHHFLELCARKLLYLLCCLIREQQTLKNVTALL